MTNDQARKLLGGYATNSLTQAERKALFEAALDDQELFDALQREEALKELLADPVSRNQIQQALAQASDSRRTASAWWSRGWVWSSVAGAVAAAVLTIVLIRSNNPPFYQSARSLPPHQSAPISPPAPIPPEKSEPAIVAPAEPKPLLRKRATRPANEPATAKALTGSLGTVEERAQIASSPAPPPPPVAAPTPRMQALRQGSFGGNAIRGPAAVASGFAVDSNGALLLRYSLAKRDSTGGYSALPNGGAAQLGDAVRLNVISAVAGYLSIYQLDPAGDWKRLFPAADPGLLVAPNATESLPDSAIIVTEVEQKFRLTLVPLDSKDTALQKSVIAPLTVDLTIGPARVP